MVGVEPSASATDGVWAVARRTALLVCRVLGVVVRHKVFGAFVRQRQHPLDWPPDQAYAVDLLRAVYGTGGYRAWRRFIRAFYVRPARRELQRAGVELQRVPSAELLAGGSGDVPGGVGDSWLLRLRPALRPAQPRAACTILFFHGGGFMAGEPLMGGLAYAAWMRALAAEGVDCGVLAAAYPLAPEHRHPAPLLGAAAAYSWLAARERPEAIIVGGDSVGGGLAVAALAALRDGGADGGVGGGGTTSTPAPPAAAPPFRPPRALLLVSPAADFTATSVFGRLAAQQAAAATAAEASGDGGGQRQQRPPLTVQAAFPCDYITEGNAAADVAALLLPASTPPDARAEAMAQPLLSPCRLAPFTGLVQSGGGALVLSGGAEAFAADVARFAARLQEEAGGLAAGGGGAAAAAVALHEEPGQPHCWPVLPLPHLAERGARVVAPFVARVLLGGSC